MWEMPSLSFLFPFSQHTSSYWIFLDLLMILFIILSNSRQLDCYYELCCLVFWPVILHCSHLNLADLFPPAIITRSEVMIKHFPPFPVS